jgi:ubiquinone/menaquinone biosynthesis C-methylase UbiE
MSATRTVFAADAVAYHASLADGWERRYQKHSFHTRHTVLMKSLQGRDLAGTLWLDAGCGTGSMARWLAQRGCSVLGVDAASEMIAAARTVQPENHSDRVSFVRITTIAHLELDDRSLDGVSETRRPVAGFRAQPQIDRASNAACMSSVGRSLGEKLVQVPGLLAPSVRKGRV